MSYFSEDLNDSYELEFSRLIIYFGALKESA